MYMINKHRLNDLVNEIRKHMKELETRFMYIGIEEMLNNINEPVYDMYDRKGYLIYRGPYYIYQPTEFNDLKAPIRYRKNPFEEKTPKYVFEDELMENGNLEIFSAKNKNLS